MARLTVAFKEQIRNLSKKELEDIVIKLASKKDNWDYLQVNYLDKECGEIDLLNEAKADIDKLRMKRYKGYAEELKRANLLSACIKRINAFTKVSKDNKLEADLVEYVLRIPFSGSEHMLGTCFTGYDYKVALLVRRLVNLVTGKLHEDFKLDYKDKINRYLDLLHRNSDHIETVYKLPNRID
nr:hypothetical protein [Bacteroidota bacterium]